MSVSMGQITLNNSTGVQFGVLPPGGAVTLQSISSAGTCYVGQVGGTLLTSSNGYPVAWGQEPLTLRLPVTSQPQVMYAIGSGAVVLGYAFETTS